MDILSNLLGRYKNFDLNRKEKNGIFIEVVFLITDLKIKEEDFEIKNNIVYLKSKPSLKSEIFIRKNKILIELNSKTPHIFLDIK